MIREKRRGNGSLSPYLCAAVYMAAYIARVDFGAAVLAICEATGFSSSMLAAALTGAFVTYGIGQLVSGYSGDKCQPRILVAAGLFSTAVMNFLLPLCTTPLQMTVVWCVNGFAQSLLWPPIVRLMATMLTEEAYSRYIPVVSSLSAALGTMLVYLMAPMLLRIKGWQAIFTVSGTIAFIMAWIWIFRSPDIPENDSQRGKSAITAENADLTINAADTRSASAKLSVLQAIMSPMLLTVMGAILMMGILRDSVTTWMPTFISETFRLGTGTSILTGVILPVFSICCTFLASRIYRLKPGNPLICAGEMFAAGTLAAVLLRIFTGNVLFSAVCMAVLAGCMHGVNVMLISMVPAFYKNTGNVSTVSGVLNACTYVGSAVSTYGVARLSEVAGWSATLTFWLSASVVGTALCFVCIRPWNRKFSESDTRSGSF